MKYLFFGLILLLVIRENSYTQVPAQTIPEFNFLQMNQKPFTNKDLPQHKKLFFMFFDADCSRCQQAVQSVGKNYKSFKGTEMFLISVDDPKKINNFMDTYGKQLKDQKNVILLIDKQNQFITRFRPKKYPGMFLYSADKKLIDYQDNEETVFRFVRELAR